jgi:hypothetical protein
MKQLKFELVHGHGVIVDDKAKIKEGDKFIHPDKTIERASRDLDGRGLSKIIFAEKELGLDVPVFEWREIVIFQKANLWFDEMEKQNKIAYPPSFIDGHKSNPAKFTEEDLRKAMDYASQITNNRLKYIDDYVKSLQKYPKWVVMESDDWEEYGERYTLFTNLQGKQQGTVKQLIWT